MADQDERAKPEIARSFSWFLQQIGDGALHRELTSELRELCAAMNQYVQDFRGAPKGKIVLTIDVKYDKGAFEVLGQFKVTKPKAPPAGAIMWSTPDNNFTQENPKQLSMFPRGPRPVDDAR